MILDNLEFDKREIEVGDLLIAEPFLDDPNFERSVVLICEVNPDGYVGFILNKLIDNLRVEDVVDEKFDIEADLYLGGPVDKEMLHFIHSYDVIDDSSKIGDNLYFGGDFEQLDQLSRVGVVDLKKVKFFIGYSGWEKEQMAEEINQNSWISTNSSKYDIFTMDVENLWKEVLKDMGGKYKMISNFPVDPNLN